MISDQDLIEILTEKALAYLRGDDANPDIGWGMRYDEAIELAESDIVREAARWNSLEALALDKTKFDQIRIRVINAVSKARSRR